MKNKVKWIFDFLNEKLKLEYIKNDIEIFIWYKASDTSINLMTHTYLSELKSGFEKFTNWKREDEIIKFKIYPNKWTCTKIEILCKSAERNVRWK